MSRILYLAGPVSGDPDHMTTFRNAETAARMKGWVVLNPTMLPKGMEEFQYLPICIAMLEQSDAVLALKRWHTSQGAKAELFYAHKQGKEVYYRMDELPEVKA